VPHRACLRRGGCATTARHLSAPLPDSGKGARLMWRTPSNAARYTLRLRDRYCTVTYSFR
jgi:hypothetical protein